MTQDGAAFNVTQQEVHRQARILIAASGSGGHLIPALHIANAIKRSSPTAVVEFIGAGRPLEETLVVQRGYTRHVIPSAGIKRGSIFGGVGFVLRLPRGIAKIVSLYRSFKPDVVVGVGGYVSVLPVLIAAVKGVPTWIHEAELKPGLANALLARVANYMSTACAGTSVKGRVKVVHTGHPVRSELVDFDRESIPADAPKRLLILGGSQGAKGLDLVASDLAPLLAQRGIEVVHQCRADSTEAVVEAYRRSGVKACVVNFIDDMAGAYTWSDVIVSRAGASSLAEIACVNRPTIFVPYPYQQGTHQSDNARVLVDKGKALLVEENEPDFPGRLKRAITELFDPTRFKAMKSAPNPLPSTDAATSIAQGVLGLAGRA